MKKKLLSLLLAAACVFSLGAFSVACGEDESEFAYRLINNGTEYEIVSSIHLAETDTFKIPSTYNGKPVTSIADGALSGWRDFPAKRIEIPNGIKYIGIGAFAEFTEPVSISIPDSVEYLARDAFSGCTNLIQTELGVQYVGNWAVGCASSVTSVTWRDDTVGIAAGIFEGCEEITEVEIPQSVKNISGGAFGTLDNITIDGRNIYFQVKDNCVIENATKTLVAGCKNSVIPNDGSVVHVGAYAFYGCRGLESIQVGNSVTVGDSRVKSVGKYAFADCDDLEYVTVAPSVLEVGEYAFYDCGKLINVILSASMTKLEPYLFANCRKLTVAGIREGVTSIGDYCFYRCEEIEEIDLPASLTEIGDYAFNNCKRLKQIEIPAKVSKIGGYIFEDCNGLESITVDIANENYHADGNCLIETNSKTLIACAQHREAVVVIPADGSVTSVGNGVFIRPNVRLPKSIKSLGNFVYGDYGGYRDDNDVWYDSSMVYYDGTQAEWNAIKKDWRWNEVLNSGDVTVFCTDGTVTIGHND